MRKYLRNKITGHIMREERIVDNNLGDWVEFKIRKVPFFEKPKPTGEKISLEEQVKKALATSLPYNPNITMEDDKLTKKEWRKLRSFHGMLSISRKQTLKMLADNREETLKGKYY